jgi:hypothetical protein
LWLPGGERTGWIAKKRTIARPAHPSITLGFVWGCAWGLGPDGLDSPIKGADFAVPRDGKIRSITGFLDQLPQGARRFAASGWRSYDAAPAILSCAVEYPFRP